MWKALREWNFLHVSPCHNLPNHPAFQSQSFGESRPAYFARSPIRLSHSRPKRKPPGYGTTARGGQRARGPERQRPVRFAPLAPSPARPFASALAHARLGLKPPGYGTTARERPLRLARPLLQSPRYPISTIPSPHLPNFIAHARATPTRQRFGGPARS